MKKFALLFHQILKEHARHSGVYYFLLPEPIFRRDTVGQSYKGKTGF